MFQTDYKPIELPCHPNELPDGNYAVSGSKFRVENGRVRSAYLLSNDMDKGVRFIQENNVTNISLNSYYDYEVQNTDCLFSLPDVTDLTIRGSWMDKTGLHSMKSLRRLDVGDLGDDMNSDVDLSFFPELQFFSGCCCKDLVIPPELPQIEKMRLWKYPKKNMTSFPHCPKLASLELIQAKLRNLEGMEWLKDSLKYLSIGYCRSLMDLSALKEMNLLALEMESISCVEQLLDVLPHCNSLLGFYFYCPGKALPTLGFLNKMPNMKCFVGIQKDITDGDLTPTIRLDNVFIPFIKRHYNLQRLENKNTTSWSSWLKQEGMYDWWPPAC